MSKIIKFKNDKGKNIIARLVERGDKYGLNWSLEHVDDNKLVEFYDDDQDKNKFTEYGQFISRYFLYSILMHEKGIDLDTDVDGWEVSTENIQQVKKEFK